MSRTKKDKIIHETKIFTADDLKVIAVLAAFASESKFLKNKERQNNTRDENFHS